MSLFKSLPLAMLVAGSTSWSPAQAAETPAPAGKGESASGQLETVTVTARRRTESAQAVPTPMSVVGGQALDMAFEESTPTLEAVADMERRRIVERCEAGREVARKALEETGRTHRGKAGLGRPFAVDPATVRAWRSENSASIAQTAEHFGIGTATVKRYCAGA